MKCKELVELLESEFPVKYAMQGDNTGFLVGDREQEIHHVYIALDANDEAIENAVKAGADFLLTHHPMIFRPMARVTSDDFNGRRVMKLIRNGIGCMAVHTNYDSCRMADLAAECMGLTECRVLEEVADGKGIGSVGLLPQEMTVRECALFVKEKFQIPSVKFFGDPQRKVHTAGICPGSGRSVVSACHAMGAEVLITGDIDHHTGIDQADDALPIIDAGHYGIEHIYIEDMRSILSEKYPELKITAAAVKHPFEVV
ncbi:MAG: Nif3-like dinuclear metal center hexameric protein [Lachnospiraceae bacterium]